MIRNFKDFIINENQDINKNLKVEINIHDDGTYSYGGKAMFKKGGKVIRKWVEQEKAFKLLPKEYHQLVKDYLIRKTKMES